MSLCTFCKTHSNMYMSKLPSWCSSLIWPCSWLQFRTHIWKYSMVVPCLHIHELAFVYDIMHLGPTPHVSYGKITNKFWYLFCPIYASIVCVWESILWNHKPYPVISTSHIVGLWVGWFFLFYFLHGYQWVREQQKRKKDHTGKPNILVFVFVFLLHESFFASRSHLWGWNTARSGLLVVFLPSREWNTLSRTDLTLFQLHRVLPEAPARNISTATKAQKMLATQMQVLNSKSPFLRGIVARCFDHPGWGECPARGPPWIWGTECWAQSKLQEQDCVSVCKFTAHDWKQSLFQGAQERWGQAHCRLHAALSASPGSRRDLGFRLESSHMHQNQLTASVCPCHPQALRVSGWLVHTLVSGCPSLIPYSRILHCQLEPRPQRGKWEL